MDTPAPALKEIFNRARFRSLAAEIRAVAPKFDEKSFLTLAQQNLDALSIMQRMRQTAESLHASLPGDFARQVATLKALAPRIQHTFVTISLSEFVALFGQDHFDISMDALRHLTAFGSSEFAIRHFLKRDFKRTLGVMQRWARDDNEHVRRLASEGSRPRLPWATRLDLLLAEPHHTFPILDTLKTDPSDYVRRSVANHLNDITKDNPDWALERISAWPRDRAETKWIVKHALRSLIKGGDRRALKLIGAGGKAKVRVSGFNVSPKRLRLGGKIEIKFTLTSESRSAQKLVVDYAIHYVKKNGGTSRKVFKLKQFELAANDTVEIARAQIVKNFTTRAHYAGRHSVELMVNGATLAKSHFDLEMR